jgi:hypothetical protein
MVTGATDRIPEFDLRTGRHLWVRTALYQAAPEAEYPMLDGENLLTVSPMHCHYCKCRYGDTVARFRCAGPWRLTARSGP